MTRALRASSLSLGRNFSMAKAFCTPSFSSSIKRVSNVRESFLWRLGLTVHADIYLGSANMGRWPASLKLAHSLTLLDWSSLAQVKEIGVVIQNCSTTALDLGQIFEIYWRASDMSSLPKHWPSRYVILLTIKLTNPRALQLRHNVQRYESIHGSIQPAVLTNEPVSCLITLSILLWLSYERHWQSVDRHLDCTTVSALRWIIAKMITHVLFWVGVFKFQSWITLLRFCTTIRLHIGQLLMTNCDPQRLG